MVNMGGGGRAKLVAFSNSNWQSLFGSFVILDLITNDRGFHGIV